VLYGSGSRDDVTWTDRARRAEQSETVARVSVMSNLTTRYLKVQNFIAL